MRRALHTGFSARLLVLLTGATLVVSAAGCGGDEGVGPSTTAGVPTIAQPGAEATSTTGAVDQGTVSSGAFATAAPARLIVATIAGKQILTDVGGFTLYVFDRDTPNGGTSACNGVCTNVWPPLIIEGQPAVQEGLIGEVSAITRRDGSTQMTYNGRPLYRYLNDKLPGDAVGDGNGGLWHAATP